MSTYYIVQLLDDHFFRKITCFTFVLNLQVIVIKPSIMLKIIPIKPWSSEYFSLYEKYYFDSFLETFSNFCFWGEERRFLGVISLQRRAIMSFSSSILKLSSSKYSSILTHVFFHMLYSVIETSAEMTVKNYFIIPNLGDFPSG